MVFCTKEKSSYFYKIVFAFIFALSLTSCGGGGGGGGGGGPTGGATSSTNGSTFTPAGGYTYGNAAFVVGASIKNTTWQWACPSNGAFLYRLAFWSDGTVSLLLSQTDFANNPNWQLLGKSNFSFDNSDQTDFKITIEPITGYSTISQTAHIVDDKFTMSFADIISNNGPQPKEFQRQ